MEDDGERRSHNLLGMEDVPKLDDTDLEENFKLLANSSMSHYFVTIDALEVEVPKDGGTDGRKDNPKSISCFLQLPTIVEQLKNKKRTINPMVDFSKSLLLISNAYIKIV